MTKYQCEEQCSIVKKQGKTMEKKRLYFDMDGVLVDFMSGVNKVDDNLKQE